MTWEFQPAAETFEKTRNDWDALNQSAGNHILLDSGFVAPLLRHFPDQGVLLGSGDDANKPGMALFVRRGSGRWETFQPAQAPIGLILLGNVDKTGETLMQITHALPGYAFQLSILQQDPDFSSFPLQTNGGAFERLDYIQTARITLEGTFEEYWKARSTNLRHNLARRRRRLTEKGFVSELAEIRSPNKVAVAIREYGILESQGWKGHDGTALAEGNAQGRFYRDVFEHFCASGEAVIFQFRLNGQVAASDLCLVRDGMMVVLKTAYDEQLNDFSPAFMMREEILQRTFGEKRVRAVEFYGRVMEWHTRWSKEIRTLYHINCFRHRWVAPLKKLVGRFA
jgi:CelD/BcsL family acetyltransferase involved in cellulose biosynthesis